MATETEKQITQLSLVKDNEYVETARDLVSFLNGGAVTINAKRLKDFHDNFKRLKALAEESLKAVEAYASTHATEGFTFSKASESVVITDSAEAIRILTEDMGMSKDDIIECSKLEPAKLMDKLGYNIKGLVNALPKATDVKLSKPRMTVK